MLTRRRLLLAALGPLLLVLAAGGYAIWLATQVRADLVAAEAAGRRLTVALGSDDRPVAATAAEELRAAADQAARRTGGVGWTALTALPVAGDDATGVRALSRSLGTVAEEGVPPLLRTVELLDRLQRGDRIDLGTVRALQQPVSRASRALGWAHQQVAGLDSAGYAAVLRGRFEEYAVRVAEADAALASGRTAVEVLPAMLGADGPRDYFVVFQNNSEIRATGGMPGSWALLHAERGRLSLTRQGTAGDFPMLQRPVLPLSAEERAVYSDQLGVYFQDANFTPDFPRVAELWRAHWDRRFPDTELDGVVSLDPIALSYLLEGTGPVTTGDLTLTSENAVEQLLSRPYLERDPLAQNVLFARTTRAIFRAVTGGLASPLDFVAGLGRAADEDRLLVAPFVPADQQTLKDTRVLGAIPENDGRTPYVDIGLNDATGSKMSYYLRYRVELRAESCAGGIQELLASIRMNQTIGSREAASLPVSVTGGGAFGTDPGSQTVFARIYGPHGGTVSDLRVNGRSLGKLDVVDLEGRPVTYVAISLDGRRDVEVTWSMASGTGQTGAGVLAVTPGVVGNESPRTFGSAC